MEENKSDSLVKEIVEKYDQNFVGIDIKKEIGIRLRNLDEFETYLKVISNHQFDSSAFQKILFNNGINKPIIFGDSFFEIKNFQGLNDTDSSSLKIQCVQNMKAVYGRLNSGNPLVHINVSFQTGTGSGIIESFQATLGGLTLGVTLARSGLLNQQVASAGNNYQYSGIYTFALNYSIFVDGFGTIYTTEISQWRIRVDGCSGQVFWIQIIQ